MGEISSLFEYVESTVESTGNIIGYKVAGIIAKKRVKT